MFISACNPNNKHTLSPIVAPSDRRPFGQLPLPLGPHPLGVCVHHTKFRKAKRLSTHSQAQV